MSLNVISFPELFTKQYLHQITTRSIQSHSCIPLSIEHFSDESIVQKQNVEGRLQLYISVAFLPQIKIDTASNTHRSNAIEPFQTLQQPTASYLERPQGRVAELLRFRVVGLLRGSH